MADFVPKQAKLKLETFFLCNQSLISRNLFKVISDLCNTHILHIINMPPGKDPVQLHLISAL